MRSHQNANNYDWAFGKHSNGKQRQNNVTADNYNNVQIHSDNHGNHSLNLHFFKK